MRAFVALFLSAALLAIGGAPIGGTPIAAAHQPAPGADPAVIAHWTPDRIAHAVWRDRTIPAPHAKPGGGGGGTRSVTGASWTKGGDVVQGTGKVYFEMGGGAWICSGTAITDNRSSYSVVLTAGHCAVDESTSDFATNWMFIPDFDASPTYTCDSTAFGCWTAISLTVPTKFATAGSFNNQATYNDWAFATVGASDRGTQLDAVVPSFPLAVAGASLGTKAYAFGYPAAGRYHGSDLTYCAGPLTEDAWNGDNTWGIACDMTGGSSGGPWFTSFVESKGTGSVSSLNSYGYSGVRYMFGPKFNADTTQTFNAADSSTGGDHLVP